jgi:hypothetical protein
MPRLGRIAAVLPSVFDKSYNLHMLVPKQFTVRAIGGLALSVLVFGMYVAVTCVRTRYRAEGFMRDMRALQLQSSNFPAVRDVMTTYGGHSFSEGCDPRLCSYTAEFQNTWLSRLHLAPFTRLSCALNVKDDLLVWRECGYFSGGFGVQVVERVPRPDIPGPLYIQRAFIPHSTGPYTRYRVFVDLTPDATADQHRLAFSMNTVCLTKLGGCQDPLALLPTVRWGKEALSTTAER